MTKKMKHSRNIMVRGEKYRHLPYYQGAHCKGSKDGTKGGGQGLKGGVAEGFFMLTGLSFIYSESDSSRFTVQRAHTTVQMMDLSWDKTCTKK